MQRAAWARPAEVWWPACPQHAGTGRGRVTTGHGWRTAFTHFLAHSVTATKPPNQVWIWLYSSTAKVSLPPPTSYVHFMEERKTTLLYVNTGPSRKGAGMGTNSTVYNKTLFAKIYVTLSIKMKVLPLHMYHSVVLLPREYGLVIFERELECEQGIQRVILQRCKSC